MGPHRIPRLSLQLFITDMLLIPIGLAIASWLRVILPFGQDILTSATRFPFLVYVVATLCWSISLVLNGVYDPKRVLRWYNEATRVITAGLLATLLLAGFLYLTFRDISRLQFGYFLFITLLLLLGYRALLRIWYRVRGRSRPGSRKNILILGAGDLGRRIARTLQDHSRWGYNLIGFLDDDVILGESMVRILESVGYQVEVVNNGKEAKAKIQNQFYNLVLLDIRLPDITGIELLSMINQYSSRTRKIVLTGFPDTNTAIRAVNEKADAYLVKPFDAEKPIEVIKENLELQKEDLKFTHEKVIEFIKNRVKELDRSYDNINEDYI